jgi:hypothetical protein
LDGNNNKTKSGSESTGLVVLLNTNNSVNDFRISHDVINVTSIDIIMNSANITLSLSKKITKTNLNLTFSQKRSLQNNEWIIVINSVKHPKGEISGVLKSGIIYHLLY